jgi:tRNA(Ile)-lysidine synthase
MAINSGAVENAARLSATLRDDAACLESMTDWFLESIEDDMSVDTEKLVGSPAAIRGRVIIALYREVSGGKSLEQVHVNDIIRLCKRCVPHSKIQLPSGIDAKIENKRLYFEKRCELPSAPEDFCVTLTDGKNSIPQINAEIITKGSQDENISENSISLHFNSAKICGSLVARNRQSSDKIKVNGVNKSIKKLLCDKKIPLEIRYRLPVICDDEGVIAVPFLAVADRARTKNGDLELKFILND